MTEKEFSIVLKAVCIRVLFEDYPDPTYILEKFPMLSNDPISAFGILDSSRQAKVKTYFEKWNMGEEFSRMMETLINDYHEIPRSEFRKKWL